MLVASDLVKRYGGVSALDSAGITLRAGEIHALVGENGAGKSTLVKILSGVVRPDAGRIVLDEQRVDFHNPRDAAARGIAIVSQELSLFPDLTVVENLFPRDLPRRWGLLSFATMAERAAPVLADLGLHPPARARVGTLPLADQQLLEITRALLTDPKVLILDEPTSALPQPAVLRLEQVLRRVVERGIAVLYISHILEEVRRLADRVSVLRDGRLALSDVPARQLGLDDLVTAMVGDASATAVRTPVEPTAAPSGPGLVLDGVSVPGRLSAVSFSVAPGEIVGVAGLEGAGHQTVLHVACGLARSAGGRLSLPGGDAPKSLREAVCRGVAYVPGDRKRFGLMLDKTVWENATAVRWLGLGGGRGWLRRRELMARAEANLARMRFRGDLLGRAGALSGGNQQKLVFAKWLDAEPSVVVLDDPTRGVDIGARAEMHDIVRGLATAGKVILLASTDLAELVGLCHRVVVFQHGRVVAELAGERLTEERLSTTMNAGFASASGPSS